MSNKKDENVVDFNQFRRSKLVESQFGKGRTPLYVSHSKGKVSGRSSDKNNFDARVTRVRSSLERINKLMQELRENS